MPWTAEDYRAGKMNLDPGAKMSEQDAINFMNRYHGDEAPGGGTPVQAPGLLAAYGGGGAGAGGGEAGPGGAALTGLNNAASGGGGSAGGASGVMELPPQGASNPNLGQRIYPVAMRQLALLPRAY